MTTPLPSPSFAIDDIDPARLFIHGHTTPDPQEILEEQNHPFTCHCGHELLSSPFWIGKIVPCPFCKRLEIVPPEHHQLSIPVPLSLSTPRLNLRLAQRKDQQAIHTIHSDTRNYDFEISPPLNQRETKKLIKKSLFPKGFWKSQTLLWVTEESKNQEILGTISLQFNIPSLSASMGFMLAHQHQGNGYATESVNELSHFLLNNWGLEKLFAMCDSKNHISQAVLKKAGFEKEGLTRKFFYHPDRGWLDSLLFARFPALNSNDSKKTDET